MNRQVTRVLAISGLLVALSVVLTRFASIRLSFAGIENIRIGLGPFPIILGGVLFGPLFGFLIGILADVIGFLISPIGAYMPHFTIISGLNGLIPGLFMIPVFKKVNENSIYNLQFTVGVIISQLLNQWLLLPWFLHMTFQIPVKVSLVPRFFSAPLQIVVFILIGLAILNHPFIKSIRSYPKKLTD